MAARPSVTRLPALEYVAYSPPAGSPLKSAKCVWRSPIALAVAFIVVMNRLVPP
jgi:hypothetical protein